MLHPSLLRCGIRRGPGSHVRQARGVPVRHGSIRRPPVHGRLDIARRIRHPWGPVPTCVFRRSTTPCRL